MENEDLRIKKNNQDISQNILIAMARGSSAEALYFKGPRERWIRFCLPDGGFLPEKSTFSHGDTAVCFRIIDRDIASKLSFEIFATEEISKVKHELHPENVVHSFTLHDWNSHCISMGSSLDVSRTLPSRNISQSRQRKDSPESSMNIHAILTWSSPPLAAFPMVYTMRMFRVSMNQPRDCSSIYSF